jgi:hypothetical protein
LPYEHSRVEAGVTRTPTRRITLLAGAARSRAACVAVLLAIAGAGLTACGNGSSGALNGEQNKSAAEVVADAEHALASARSVHVVGESTTDGQQAHIDLRLTGANAVGSIRTGAANISLVTVGNTAYVKGYGSQLAPAVAAKLRNTWIKQSTAAGHGTFTIEAISTSLTRAFTPTGSVTRGKLHGHPVVIVHGVDQGQAAAIWVANTGPAYPLRLVGTSSGTATLDLRDYGAPVRIKAPNSALDATEVARLINGG